MRTSHVSVSQIGEAKNNHLSLGHRRKRTTPWQGADLVFALGAQKTPMLCLHAVTDEDGHPLENENENESGRRQCEYWCTIFQAHVDGERHQNLETILSYVQRAPDSICWEIDRNEFDERLAIKKRICSGPRWDSIWPLQMCGRLGFSVSLLRL